MKRVIAKAALLLMLLSGCSAAEISRETIPSAESTLLVTEPITVSISKSDKKITPLPPEPVLEFSSSEKEMLLKIGMVELGRDGCPECVALVMRTVLNRVKAERFGSSIQAVLHAPEQFTPVMDGSFAQAKPNELCYDAYEMVVHGWDESQGALYYEFCQGESWHSQNLHLLFQHCNTRFYD